MIRGLYVGATGMLAESYRVDAISNNLANVNTAGYKRDNVINKDFAEMLINRTNDGERKVNIGSMGLGTMIDAIAPNFEIGMMQHTGNDFDVALQGEGFFVVETENGQRYTRNGSFIKNAQNELVTLNGNRVMGENGPIVLPDNDGQFVVEATGQVYLGGELIDRLQIVDFPNKNLLQKEGNSLFFDAGNQQIIQVDTLVQQGTKENSNVNVVREMVDLIMAQRTYEANSKTVSTQDRALEKLINEVGRNA